MADVDRGRKREPGPGGFDDDQMIVNLTAVAGGFRSSGLPSRAAEAISVAVHPDGWPVPTSGLHEHRPRSAW